MIFENIPNKVWALIVGNDMRLWNTLVRAIPCLSRSMLAREMKMEFTAPMLDTENQPATSRKLLSNTEGQPAAVISKFSEKLKIYAVDGIPTRTDGPAIMLFSWSALAVVDIYYQNGTIEMIDILKLRPSKATLTIILMNSATHSHVTEHYRGEYVWRIRDEYPQKNIQAILEASSVGDGGGYAIYRDESHLKSARLAISTLLDDPYAQDAIDRVVRSVLLLTTGC